MVAGERVDSTDDVFVGWDLLGRVLRGVWFRVGYGLFGFSESVFYGLYIGGVVEIREIMCVVLCFGRRCWLSFIIGEDLVVFTFCIYLFAWMFVLLASNSFSLIPNGADPMAEWLFVLLWWMLMFFTSQF